MTDSLPAPDSPGAPAAHGILASFVAIAVVLTGSVLGLRDRNSGGDASAFDVLTTATTTTAAPGPTASPTVPPPPTPGPLPVDDSAASVSSAVTEAPTTTVAADNNRVPTSTDKLRLYIAGDSDAGNLGPPLEQTMQDTGLVQSTLHYKVSTGLTRPEYYNWPQALATDVAKIKPDVVVVTFGGNDAQDMALNGRSYPVDSPEWQAEYGRRVGKVMDFLSADGRTLIWAGIPNAESDKFRARLQILETVTRAEAVKRPQVVYIKTWDIFVGPNGGYAAYHQDPRDGIGKPVRAGDGFHLNVTGSEILATFVATAVRDDMIARGAKL